MGYIICWALFAIICTIGFFVAFHYDRKASLYSKSRGFDFDFNDVPKTALTMFGALLLGIATGGMMVLFWPVFLVLFIVLGIAFGIAYGLKRFFTKKD